jgi:alpha-D-ribose 1-methylphosphonate 5-triphosphate synthase subunit PhnG
MGELRGPARAGDSPAAESRRDNAAIKARLLGSVAAAGLEEVTAMLDRLWSLGGFRVQRAPRSGLVMVTVNDPFDTLFHLGEVLVSEAEVVFEGIPGYGAICGDEPERALLLAAVEAVERSGRTALLVGIREWVGRLEEKCAAEKRISSKLAAATGVRFESMKKENVEFGSLGG